VFRVENQCNSSIVIAKRSKKPSPKLESKPLHSTSSSSSHVQRCMHHAHAAPPSSHHALISDTVHNLLRVKSYRRWYLPHKGTPPNHGSVQTTSPPYSPHASRRPPRTTPTLPPHSNHPEFATRGPSPPSDHHPTRLLTVPGSQHQVPQPCVVD
jgi:hypothetical protein